jgi:hypothetical protein
VIRPANPEQALATAKEIMRARADGEITGDEAEHRFTAMLQAQQYTFVGIACADTPALGEELLVLDNDHHVIEGESMRPGDSFVPLEQLLASASRVDSRESTSKR